MKKNLHIIFTEYETQSRLRKSLLSLLNQNLFDEIDVVHVTKLGISNLHNGDDKKISIFSVKVKTSFFLKGFILKLYKYIIFQIYVYNKFKKNKYDAVNCHSLLVLPVGYFLKLNGNVKKLIYDAHELETERIGMSLLERIFSRYLEKILIKEVDHLIVVSKPIEYWYISKYDNLKVTTIHNFPNRQLYENRDSFDLKKMYNINNDDILFIYQGILSKARGIDFLLNIFSKCNTNRHILFLGYGDSVELIKNMEIKHINIHYHPTVNYQNLYCYTSSADVGIHFIEKDQGLSYKFSLPNKFGEYIMSGIPIIVSENYLYLGQIIKKNDLGWILSNNINSFINFVNNLNQDSILEKKNNVGTYSSKISWENETLKFSEIYN